MLTKIARIGSKKPGSITATVLANVGITCTGSVIFIKLYVDIITKVEIKNIDETSA